MKKKIIPIVCFLLTLVLCVAAYATVSSVRHREKNDTDNSKRDNFYEVIFKKKVSAFEKKNSLFPYMMKRIFFSKQTVYFTLIGIFASMKIKMPT